MKRTLACLLLAVVLALPILTLGGCAADAGQAAAQSRSGVVRIAALRPDGYYSLGTGFGVGTAGKPTDTFITNRHVVYATVTLDGNAISLPAVSVYILKNSSAWNPITGLDTSQCIPCEVLYPGLGDKEYPDVAVLKAAETPADRVALPLQAKEEGLSEGNGVTALGYPSTSDAFEQGVYGDTWVAAVADVTITSGMVSRFSSGSAMGNTRLIQHTAQINHGNSGGPLLDQNGAVVGINTYGAGQDASTGDGNSYYAVRIQYGKDILDDLGISYDVYAGGPPAWAIVLIAAAVLAAIAAALVLLRKKPGVSPHAGPAVPAGPATEYRIQGQSGVFAGRRFAVNGQVRIGRDPACNDLVYPANTQGVSGAHCVITLSGGGLTLTDLGSRYGTFLRGGKLTPNQPVPLNLGDRFSLGSDKESFVITGKGGGMV